MMHLKKPGNYLILELDETEILAAMQGSIFKGGGDYPANEFIIGSGDNALLCRYFSGRRKLDSIDQLTLEFAGVYRHYHSALMRTISDRQSKERTFRNAWNLFRSIKRLSK